MTRASKIPTLTGKYPMNNGEGRQMKAPNKALHVRKSGFSALQSYNIMIIKFT